MKRDILIGKKERYEKEKDKEGRQPKILKKRKNEGNSKCLKRKKMEKGKGTKEHGKREARVIRKLKEWGDM